MKNYLKRTWKKKLLAIVMSFIGYLSTLIEGDGTAFVFILFFAIALFFDSDKQIKGE